MKISAVLVAILVSLSLLMVAQDAGSNHNCPALGKQYETKLDKFTKIGRVAWSPYLKSCVAETNNIMSGTEVYSVMAIPSEKFLGASGGLTSFLDTKRDQETAHRQELWERAILGPAAKTKNSQTAAP